METQKQQSDIGILDEFQNDFIESWHRLPNKAFFAVLVVAWLVLFQVLGNSTFGYIDSSSIFKWMWSAYNSPMGDDGHGPVVPIVVLGLLWWKRKELLAVRLEVWWPALALVAMALMLHVFAYTAQFPQLSIVALMFGIYALSGLAWGPRWLRLSFFPFACLVFCVPLGGQGQLITTPLRHLVAKIVTVIAHLGIEPDLVRDGTQLFNSQRTFSYDIAPACSGIRSLVTLLGLTTVYGFISFKTPWKRGVMVLSAVPLAILGNVVRITFTVVVAGLFSQEAGKSVETNFGFVTFGVAIVCIIYIAKWLGVENFKPDSAEERAR